MTYSQKQEKAINRLTYNSRNYLGLIVLTFCKSTIILFNVK